MRPLKKPAERTCPICKIEMEDEYHFLNICPAYQEKQSLLLDYLEKEFRIKTSSNHRLESAGLKALEALLFKMGIERMVMRALF